MAQHRVSLKAFLENHAYSVKKCVVLVRSRVKPQKWLLLVAAIQKGPNLFPKDLQFQQLIIWLAIKHNMLHPNNDLIVNENVFHCMTMQCTCERNEADCRRWQFASTT